MPIRRLWSGSHGLDRIWMHPGFPRFQRLCVLESHVLSGDMQWFIPTEKCNEPEKGWQIADPFVDLIYGRILEYRRSDRKYTYTELTQHTFGYIFSDAGIIRASGKYMGKTGTLV